MYTNKVFGTTKCVMFIEVSSFQGVLIYILYYCIYVLGNVCWVHVEFIAVQICCVWVSFEILLMLKIKRVLELR